MPEVTCDHELQRLSRARRIASDHGIPGHDLANGRDMGINSLRRNLYQHIITQRHTSQHLPEPEIRKYSPDTPNLSP